jgi:hypothetical protein
MQPSVQSADVKLTLPDGTRILADGSAIKPHEEVSNVATIAREVKSGREAVKVLEKMHRKLGDLPDEPLKMNPIAAIITYSAIGLDNEDIATALGATKEQIETIKESDAYAQLADMFDKTVFEDEKRNAKHIISKAASKAAATMVSLVDSNREDIALTASRDVLKHAGVATDDDSGQRVGGLRIVVVRKGEHADDEISVELNK